MLYRKWTGSYLSSVLKVVRESECENVGKPKLFRCLYVTNGCWYSVLAKYSLCGEDYKSELKYVW